VLYKYQSEKEPAIASKSPFYVIGSLQVAVKKWADNTVGLLDHVHFEAEPMKNVEPGDPLDFSSARESEAFEPARTRRLSKKEIAEGRALIAKMRTSQAECRIAEPEPIYDSAYFDALSYLDGEALKLSFEGTAKIEEKVEEIL
jgi:hypothetical protein